MLNGLRFQKRIRLPLGFRVNLSKTGVGWSGGLFGFRFGRDARGKKYQSVNLPGSGFTYKRFSSDPPADETSSKNLRKR
jgi:Protein of unknown function (DUF4236)